MKKQFCVSRDGDDLKTIPDNMSISGETSLIDYKQVSHYFGLHKDSLNHISNNLTMSVNRVKKLFHLRHIYQSMDPNDIIAEEDQKSQKEVPSRVKGQLNQSKVIPVKTNQKVSKSFLVKDRSKQNMNSAIKEIDDYQDLDKEVKDI